MTNQATATSPPPGTLGFDTSASLSASQATALAAAGYRFAIRCIGYQTVPVLEPLTLAEVQGLQAAGLMEIQVPGRQFQMFQCAPWDLAAGGTAIDVDVVQVDASGGTPVFWAGAAS